MRSGQHQRARRVAAVPRTRVRIAAWTNVHPPAPACAARLGLGIGNPVGDDQMRMSGHRARRSTGLWLVALIAASCATPEATPPPSSPAAPGPVTSPSASTTPSAVASPTEASSTAPSSAAATTLAIKWNAEDLTGIGKVEAILGVVRVGDGYVLLASLPYVDEGSPNSAVWWSNDGTSWTLAKEFPVEDRILTLTAGGPGFVVAGFNDSDEDAAVWTSTDGRDWQPVDDPSLSKAVISQLVTTDSGLVGFGWRSDDNEAQGLWTSADGVEWLAATNESGVTVARGLEAVASDGGRAIAFVSEGEKKPPAIWETTGRAEWTRTGALPDVASIGRVAGGARGWVALGDNRAWTSADGRTWTKGVPGPDVDSDVIVDDAGYVAVGFVGSLPGETCGDQRPFAGHTWTSADGLTWDRMKVTDEFKAAMVTKLLVVDRTLVGYGQRVKGDDGSSLPVALWWDTLPDLTEPAGASDEASVPKSCGP